MVFQDLQKKLFEGRSYPRTYKYNGLKAGHAPGFTNKMVWGPVVPKDLQI